MSTAEDVDVGSKLTKQQRYRQKNKELINKKKRQKYQQNKASVNAKRRDKHAKNKDRINKQRRAHYAETKQKVNQARRCAYAECKDEINEKRRAAYSQRKTEINEQRRKKYQQSENKKTTKTKHRVRQTQQDVQRNDTEMICPGCTELTFDVCSHCKSRPSCSRCTIALVMNDAEFLTSLPWQKMKTFAQKTWQTNKSFHCLQCWERRKKKAQMQPMNMAKIREEFNARSLTLTPRCQIFEISELYCARADLKAENIKNIQNESTRLRCLQNYPLQCSTKYVERLKLFKKLTDAEKLQHLQWDLFNLAHDIERNKNDLRRLSDLFYKLEVYLEENNRRGHRNATLVNANYTLADVKMYMALRNCHFSNGDSSFYNQELTIWPLLPIFINHLTAQQSVLVEIFELIPPLNEFSWRHNYETKQKLKTAITKLIPFKYHDSEKHGDVDMILGEIHIENERMFMTSEGELFFQKVDKKLEQQKIDEMGRTRKRKFRELLQREETHELTESDCLLDGFKALSIPCVSSNLCVDEPPKKKQKLRLPSAERLDLFGVDSLFGRYHSAFKDK